MDPSTWVEHPGERDRRLDEPSVSRRQPIGPAWRRRLEQVFAWKAAWPMGRSKEAPLGCLSRV